MLQEKLWGAAVSGLNTAAFDLQVRLHRAQLNNHTSLEAWEWTPISKMGKNVASTLSYETSRLEIFSTPKKKKKKVLKQQKRLEERTEESGGSPGGGDGSWEQQKGLCVCPCLPLSCCWRHVSERQQPKQHFLSPW